MLAVFRAPVFRILVYLAPGFRAPVFFAPGFWIVTTFDR
jgi:hypothetical protein